MREPINYEILPEHMRDAMRTWIETPHNPRLLGSFMYAVLTNDLMGAFANADHINRASMYAWTVFLHNEAPAACFGSEARLLDWFGRGGLKGMMQQ